MAAAAPRGCTLRVLVDPRELWQGLAAAQPRRRSWSVGCWCGTGVCSGGGLPPTSTTPAIAAHRSLLQRPILLHNRSSTFLPALRVCGRCVPILHDERQGVREWRVGAWGVAGEAGGGADASGGTSRGDPFRRCTRHHHTYRAVCVEGCNCHKRRVTTYPHTHTAPPPHTRRPRPAPRHLRRSAPLYRRSLCEVLWWS